MSGIKTFLFTDIEGSTKLSQEFPHTLQTALERHYKILCKAIESNNGFVFEIVGDAFCSSFENPHDAIRSAIDIQMNLAKEKWKDVTIKVRIGIHSGNAEWNGKRYIGYITLATVSRVMSAAYGEQILISGDTHKLLSQKNSYKLNLNRDDDDKASFRDLGDRKLKDVVQPVRLYQVIYKNLRTEFPPLKTPDARLSNLPEQLNSFIGREEELKKIKELLKHNRLLTLTGSGGTGKTRLALQTGAGVIDDFTHGVWFADLAVLRDESLLAQTILLAIGAKEVQKQSIDETISNYLKDKEALLILDNCEHVINECARLTEKLLSKCPKLKIVATSREALKCSGEVIFKVASLSTPNINEKIPFEQLIKYESVKLFIDRAVSVNQNFKINDNNIKSITEICYRLDGIPLAIELASAYIKILTAENILRKITDRFTVLSSGKRTAQQRHQTIYHMIDWSYGLLSDKEKDLFEKLSVFPGTLNIDAAETVCQDESTQSDEIFFIMNNLIDKSLLGTIEMNSEIRFSMLQIIRQYGISKLESSGEFNTVQKKFCNYYLNLVKKFEAELKKEDQKFWLEKFERENENFRHAIILSKKNDPETALNISSSLTTFWVLKGYYSEGFNTLKNVLHDCVTPDNELNAGVLANAGYIACEYGEYKEAREFLQKSLEFYNKQINRKGASGPLITLGLINYYKGETDKARKFYEEALVISRETGYNTDVVNSLVNLGVIDMIKGNYESSYKLFQESLITARELKDTFTVARIMTNLATIERYKSNYEKANLFYEESLLILRGIGDNQGVAHILANLANTAFLQKDYSRSETLNLECLKISEGFDYKPTLMLSILRLAELACVRNDLTSAKKFYKDYIRIFKDNEDKEKLAFCFIELAKIEFDSENFERAAKLISSAEEILRKEDKQNDIKILNDPLKLKDELKNKMGNEKFEFAYEYMKTFTYDQLINLALESN